MVTVTEEDECASQRKRGASFRKVCACEWTGKRERREDAGQMLVNVRRPKLVDQMG